MDVTKELMTCGQISVHVEKKAMKLVVNLRKLIDTLHSHHFIFHLNKNTLNSPVRQCSRLNLYSCHENKAVLLIAY